MIEPAVNEISAEPLPAVADNDVGAPGAAAEIVIPHEESLEESLFDSQLPVETPNPFTART